MKTLYQKNRAGLLIIVTVIVIFFGCQKTENTVTPPPPVITVTASVAGSVTDLNNAPVSGATVSAGTSVTTTGANGLFIINNIQLDEDAGFVSISKPGFFTGSRTFLVNANTVNNLKIQLIPKTVSGSFDAASGGNINISGGGSVNFGANNVVNTSNGAAYTGTVSVSTFYLNPADANFSQYMPGDLRGVNTSSQESILHSFGMVSVELDDASGGKLQIAGGKTATITIPIPSAMQAKAPATIPLWYFDETKGLWKQEGTATKQNNTYVGTVAHFSFWTAGQLAQSVKLNAKFVFDTSSVIIAVANKLVTITSANYGTTNAYTDSAGTVSGLVPANETLAMKVFNDCGDSIYEKNIGPFNTDTDLGTITVTGITCYNPPPVITLSATLKDQNGNALAGNVVLITNATFYDSINTSSTGQFSVGVPSGQSFVMKVYDQCIGVTYTQNIGPFTSVTDLGTLTITVTPPVSVTLSGTVVDCNNNAVTNGSVYANIGNNQFSSPIANGNFAITFNRCSSSPTPATITVYDVATGQYIPAPPITVTNSNQNIGQIIIPCGSPDSSYIKLTLNGIDYSWYNSSTSGAHGDTTTSIIGGSTDSLPYVLGVIWSGSALPGTYTFGLYTIISTNVAYNTYNNNLNTVVTEYGGVGEYISGTATGWIKNFPVATSDSFPFSCSYRVKRIQ